jgi:hypothetical protein
LDPVLFLGAPGPIADPSEMRGWRVEAPPVWSKPKLDIPASSDMESPNAESKDLRCSPVGPSTPPRSNAAAADAAENCELE